LGYAALRRATRYASERVVFGRPSAFPDFPKYTNGTRFDIVSPFSVGQNQAIQHPLAVSTLGSNVFSTEPNDFQKSWIDLEAGKLLTYSAAKAYDELAEKSTSDASDSSGSGTRYTDLGARCNAAKYFAAEAAFNAW